MNISISRLNLRFRLEWKQQLFLADISIPFMTHKGFLIALQKALSTFCEKWTMNTRQKACKTLIEMRLSEKAGIILTYRRAQQYRCCPSAQ